MPEQSGLLREFARQKGLATFDDVESKPAFEMKACHELIVSLEHCTSQRPSHHLRGSNIKYTNQMSMLSGCLEPAAGDGQLHLKVNEEAGSPLSSARGRSNSSSPSKRPSSAPPTRRSLGGMSASEGLPRVDAFGNPIGRSFSGDEKYPRVGSFEVHVTLHNKEFQRRYGPVLVYSKIKTGQWPSFTKLRKTVDAVMQQLLAEDDQACALEKEFRKQHPARPVMNQGEEDESGKNGDEADEDDAADAEAAAAAAAEAFAAETAAAAAAAAEAAAAEAEAGETAAAVAAAAAEAAISALTGSSEEGGPAEIGMLAGTDTKGTSEAGSLGRPDSHPHRAEVPGDGVDVYGSS
jgi:hypothetical protein